MAFMQESIIDIYNYDFKILFNNWEEQDYSDLFFMYNNMFLRNKFLKICKYIKLDVLKSDHYIFDTPKIITDKCNYLDYFNLSSTGFLILSTSHLAWHTFPENNFISLQISTCGEYIEKGLIAQELIKNLHGVKSIV